MFPFETLKAACFAELFHDSFKARVLDAWRMQVADLDEKDAGANARQRVGRARAKCLVCPRRKTYQIKRSSMDSPKRIVF